MWGCFETASQGDRRAPPLAGVGSTCWHVVDVVARKGDLLQRGSPRCMSCNARGARGPAGPASPHENRASADAGAPDRAGHPGAGRAAPGRLRTPTSEGLRQRVYAPALGIVGDLDWSCPGMRLGESSISTRQDRRPRGRGKPPLMGGASAGSSSARGPSQPSTGPRGRDRPCRAEGSRTRSCGRTSSGRQYPG
jgi:hypothetical protein